MRNVVDSATAKYIDQTTIHEVGIPSMVLMEKASMAVAACAMSIADSRKDRILAVCGTGNNGGDGVAAARLLQEAGYNISVLVLGQEEKCTEEMQQQLHIAETLGVSVFWDNMTQEEMVTETRLEEYTIGIDAMFGIGLTRAVQGKYAAYIRWMNQAGIPIISADVPSGVDGSSGAILGEAVRADCTVTFGCNKMGLLLYPGAEYAGQVIVADIGIPQQITRQAKCNTYTFEGIEDVQMRFPARKMRSHKGSYGKVLVIAGGPEMSGACYFSAKAAYRMGCGLVQIFTSQTNAAVLRTRLPEAIVTTWSSGLLEQELQSLSRAIREASAIVFGPGLGRSEDAKQLCTFLLDELENYPEKPVIIDADGLNILAEMGRYHSLGSQFILTPHLKEMSRLCGQSVSEISTHMPETVMGQKSGAVVVLKDARTLVSDGCALYINTTGNSGLSTGGSGDVLSGMIGGLLAQGVSPMDSACLAVYLHGMTADRYTEQYAPHSMMADDILQMLPEVLAESRVGN